MYLSNLVGTCIHPKDVGGEGRIVCKCSVGARGSHGSGKLPLLPTEALAQRGKLHLGPWRLKASVAVSVGQRKQFPTVNFTVLPRWPSCVHTFLSNCFHYIPIVTGSCVIAP